MFCLFSGSQALRQMAVWSDGCACTSSACRCCGEVNWGQRTRQSSSAYSWLRYSEYRYSSIIHLEPTTVPSRFWRYIPAFLPDVPRSVKSYGNVPLFCTNAEKKWHWIYAGNLNVACGAPTKRNFGTSVPFPTQKITSFAHIFLTRFISACCITLKILDATVPLLLCTMSL